jgi:uncharacterized protein (DUF58 family)
MLKFLEYYGKYQSVRGNLGGLPGWGRFVLLVVALPGVALIALSVLALLASILALLLLTVPVYRFLQWLSGASLAAESGDESPMEGGVTMEAPYPLDSMPSPGRKQVEVKIVQ